MKTIQGGRKAASTITYGHHSEKRAIERQNRNNKRQKAIIHNVHPTRVIRPAIVPTAIVTTTTTTRPTTDAAYFASAITTKAPKTTTTRPTSSRINRCPLCSTILSSKFKVPRARSI
ncbi:hypothetical protein Pmani_000581 [Petrolisthes manimaculis]|uniref:Uncharacterized protein n=1 Tax=Petrolisthes manimaculis TaxID=1843537 RepID=A0AAE1PG73_9EUCA|nr:hypothetical protein Pmani_021500 [Petrolisthes manimaculis]KAK4329050.1 hypothetical protein Pmani_000581 [Petrolisthes manimaculis]